MFKKFSFSQYKELLVIYLKPVWFRALVLTLLLFGNASFQLINLQLIGSFIDKSQSDLPLIELTYVAALFLGVVFFGQVVSALTAYFAEDIGWRVTNVLRADLASHCLQLDLSFHYAHTPGELIERIDGDIAQLTNFFSTFVIRIVGIFLIIVGALLLLLLQNWWVGLLVTLYVILSMSVLSWWQRRLTPYFKENRQIVANLSGFFGERLESLEDIRSSGAQEYVMLQLYKLLRLLLQSARKLGLLFMTYRAAAATSEIIAVALIFTLGAFLFKTGLMTLGTVYIIVRYAFLLTGNLEAFTMQIQDFLSASASLERIRDLYYTASKISNTALGENPPLLQGALSIEFQDVSFGYSEGNPVLQNISFRVEPGKVLGIIGRTGSGKSTISRLLFRLHDPEQGSIFINDVDIRTIHLSDLRQYIGLVTQEVQLFQGTIRENITFFDSRISDEVILQAIKSLGIWDWYSTLPLGLNTQVTSHGGGLSAGEAQLLALTRVFLKDPGLIILDEASARLDPVTEGLIGKAINILLKDRSGIIIAHHLKTIERANQILILDDGCVCEYGDREQLQGDSSSYFAFLLRTGKGEQESEEGKVTNRSSDLSRENKAEHVLSEIIQEIQQLDEEGTPAKQTHQSVKTGILYRGTWTFLWKLVRYRPWLYLAFSCCSLLMAPYSLVLGLLLQTYFNVLGSHLNASSFWSQIWQLLALLFGALFLYSSSGLGMYGTFHWFKHTITALLRRNLFMRLLRLPGAQALPSSSGEILSHLIGDIETVGKFLIDIIDETNLMLMALVAFFIMLIKSPVMSLSVIIPILLIGIASHIASRHIRDARRVSRQLSGQVNSFIGEMFASVQAIQVTVSETPVVTHLHQLNEARRRAALKERLISEVMEVVAMNTANLSTGFMLLFIGQALRSGSITAGDFAFFVYTLGLVTYIVPSFNYLRTLYEQMKVSFERLTHLLQEDPLQELTQHAPVYLSGPFPSLPYEAKRESHRLVKLEVRALTYLYPMTGRGIKDISLQIKRGQFIAITGRIGSGKTTLLRTLLGLLPKDTGEIRWNDELVNQPSNFFIPPRSAYTPQLPRLCSDTLKDNILMGLPEDVVDLQVAIQSAVMERDLQDLEAGLLTIVGPRGVKLSGGQVQRSAAARMFVRNAELLVFDDLSSALDVETERILWKRVFALQGVTCLVVSHSRAVFEHADHILVLKDGKVEAEGQLAYLLETCEEMRHMWNNDQEVGEVEVR